MNKKDTNSTARHHVKRCGITRRAIFKVCSAILVPIMIGLLTVTVSIVQLHIASKQRNQDLKIAEDNRVQDRLMANKLRWDSILATYIKEISQIFTSLNFSFGKIDPLVTSIIRAKTLTACRQLDVERKAWLIQFLYESGAILVGQNPIDMTNANLNGIDLSTSVFNSIQQASLRLISLSGASLINASFDERHLNGANFSGCTMMGASFKRVRLDDASFQKASLRGVNFYRSSTKSVNFVWSDLRRSNLDNDQLHSAKSFFLTILPNGTFGRHPNLLSNGNAEEERFCSLTRVAPILDNHWIVTPSRQTNSIGLMRIDASAVQKQVDYEWTEIIAHSSIDEDMITNADIAWNVGRCSFVATKLFVSLIQHFKIPQQYQSLYRPPHSWHLTILCGKLVNVDIKISLSLQERNNQNETLQTYTFG